MIEYEARFGENVDITGLDIVVGWADGAITYSSTLSPARSLTTLPITEVVATTTGFSSANTDPIIEVNSRRVRRAGSGFLSL